MATLLLTAVGSAVGGPIGGAIGALVGQRVDQALLAPKRQGARLADLSVQSSSYGASIPKVFGRMRVSGTVIWATDLREERRKVSQGKGRPKATVYSYSASFAVLLSGRPTGRIGRIWADGKLLRGGAGDFKVETGFRFHCGAADQPADPLIASAEGPSAPAYRGRAYAVFEDMALESFGNRIPMLSFEVIADDDPVDASAILTRLAGSELRADPLLPLEGFVADGTVGAALTPIFSILSLQLKDDGATIAVGAFGDDPIDIVERDLVGGVRPELSRPPAASLPTRADIGFADIDRDYQSGVQSIDLHAEGGRLQLDLPAALSAPAAATLAGVAMFRARLDGQAAILRLPWRYLPCWSAGGLSLEGRAWKVAAVRFDAMSLVFQLRPLAGTSIATFPGDGGRATVQPDLAVGETTLRVVELPFSPDRPATAPLVVAAATGSSPGWRFASLMMRLSGRSEWQDIGSTAAPAVIGACVGALRPASPHLLDLRNSLTVQLLHDGIALLNADDAALDAGANSALVGTEVIQFGRADRLGPGLWRLSRLMRGRRGTEAFSESHSSGELFLLLDPDTLFPLPLPPGTTSVDVAAKSAGDVQIMIAEAPVLDKATRPLPPVHARIGKRTDGGVLVEWVRQSRDGWRWRDTVDAPLSEEMERYRIFISAAGQIVELNTSAPMLELSEPMIRMFRDKGAVFLDVAIAQVGRFGVSDSLETSIPL